MAIIDAYQHRWNLEKIDYPRITPAFDALNRSFTENELEPQLVEAGVDRTVLIRAANSIAGSEFMFEVAARSHRAAGVVAWVSLGRVS